MPDWLSEMIRSPDWISEGIAFLSLLVAVVCARIAVKESKAKEREAKARVAEARKYIEALDTVISAGGSMPQHLESIANKTKEFTELARREIEKSVEHLRKATHASEEISDHLRNIGNVALRAQRDSLRAHRALIKAIERSDEPKSNSERNTPADPPLQPTAEKRGG